MSALQPDACPRVARQVFLRVHGVARGSEPGYPGVRISKREDGVARHKGTVTWFNDIKGFGFIRTENGRDVFVNYQEIERDGFQTLNVGENVSFEIEGEEHAPKALRVVPEK
jgi:CspA family cold shock protein